jgi:hypothetical protein
MRYRFLLISALSLVLAHRAAAAPSETAPVKVIVVGNNWGVSTDNVQAILDSIARERLVDFPNRTLGTLLVSRWSEVPITLNQKGPHGEFQVRLTADKTYWAQYTYQFAHEMGHILANCDHRKAGPNLWFEEALCETSSLFVLSRMHHAWETAPPYPNWKDWGIHFDEYLDKLLAERARRLPPDMTMKQWLAANLPELQKQNRLTERSKLVAAYLFPLFQDDPAGWQTLNAINTDPADAGLPFDAYLQAWKNRLPEKQKPFLAKIQTLFGYTR